MLKVVVDTNVFISGLIKAPACRNIIRSLEKWEFILVVSPEILDELVGVISRPKFHNIIDRDIASRLIETIKSQALFVWPTVKIDAVKDDPDDNIFLEAAVTAKADCLVTSDNHLLKLRIFSNIPILTPIKFIPLLKTPK